MVHVIDESSNLLLNKAELTILLLPSLKAEKHGTVTVCSNKEKPETCIHASQENKE